MTLKYVMARYKSSAAIFAEEKMFVGEYNVKPDGARPSISILSAIKI